MNNILIIEDDVNIAELERDYLEVHGFTADVFYEGIGGLEAALTGDYDLVLLDVMLPNMDGFAICREIRANLDIPVLMVSARVDDIDKIRALGLGSDDYIVKPFSPAELIARVKSHLSRYDRLTQKERIRKNQLIIGRLTVDIDARKVFIANTEILLKNKEFDLLLFLVEHPNHVFSKDVLYDRIWGMDAYGDMATVAVHINRIRDKIEADSANPEFIETVWGAGYRFKV